MQDEKKLLLCKTTFDIKLEKLVNTNTHANKEVASTVKLVSSGKINSIEETNEEVMSTVKLESSDKIESDHEESAI